MPSNSLIKSAVGGVRGSLTRAICVPAASRGSISSVVRSAVQSRCQPATRLSSISRRPTPGRRLCSVTFAAVKRTVEMEVSGLGVADGIAAAHSRLPTPAATACCLRFLQSCLIGIDCMFCVQVTRHNFKEVLPQVKQALADCQVRRRCPARASPSGAFATTPPPTPPLSHPSQHCPLRRPPPLASVLCVGLRDDWPVFGG
jgi:hypothetical protein